MEPIVVSKGSKGGSGTDDAVSAMPGPEFR